MIINRLIVGTTAVIGFSAWINFLRKMADEEGDSGRAANPDGAQEFDDPNTETGAFGGMGGLIQSLFESLRQKPPGEQLLDSLTIEGVANYIKENKCKNIVVMTGAGVSTSAGIPDFRSPGSGLYDNLAKYNLPYPEAIFEINYFRENPEPFFTLAKALYPGKLKPTPCHYFIKLLHDKGILLRLFTQNVDTLELVAGIPVEKVIEAHGSFRLSHCTNGSCKKEYSQEWMKDKIFADEIPRCTECEAVVKPDIIFFGEALPERFFTALKDLGSCDLLIVMGTSLAVQPFASLVDRVGTSVPRLLINRDKVGHEDFLGLFGGGMNFDSEQNYRDVCWLGDCDTGAETLAELLGWKDELSHLIEREWKRIDAVTSGESLSKGSAETSTSSDSGVYRTTDSAATFAPTSDSAEKPSPSEPKPGANL